mmetsp:Transcript_5686/g.9323  ORF Transcript_5686/g.9323 Transcript_5686/m.9323 type:complete len:84 (-) Transcript_5686:774-1025(-)
MWPTMVGEVVSAKNPLCFLADHIITPPGNKHWAAAEQLHHVRRVDDSLYDNVYYYSSQPSTRSSPFIGPAQTNLCYSLGQSSI